MLNNILNWAQKEDAVRALILTGSRAKNNRDIDRFSDFDIALFVTEQKKYTGSDSWIHTLGNVWVYIPEEISLDGQKIPTRLIVFDGGIGADISLWSIDQLDKLVTEQKLPFACECGFSVLIDKDKVACNLPAAPGKRMVTNCPSQKEFESAIKIFFFEAFNCAKYIARNDLWHAKLRDWTTKEYLLRMIEWHAHAMHGQDYDTFWHGKNMHKWIDKDLWAALNNCFGRFDANDSRKALTATINLFGTVAKQTAERLGYPYPISIDENITRFIQAITQRQKVQYHFAFKLIEEKDVPLLQPLLHRWFKMPHVKKWWPIPNESEDFFNSFLKRIRSGTKPYLVFCNDLPIGYIQCYNINKSKDTWLPELPDNVIGTDQFIGEPDYLGKGIGTLFIQEFVKNLAAKDKLDAIIVDPDPTNIVAIKCYEKVGFKKIGIYQAPWGPALLMIYKTLPEST